MNYAQLQLLRKDKHTQYKLRANLSWIEEHFGIRVRNNVPYWYFKH